MKKIDLLYNSILARLNQLNDVDDESITAFYNNLDDVNQNKLVRILEDIAAGTRKIESYRDSRIFYIGHDELTIALSELESSFQSYPNFRVNEIYGLITILEKITMELSETEIDLENEIDVNLFELCPFSTEIYPNNFFHFDNDHIENSILLLNLNKKSQFKEFIDNTTEGTDILFHLLHFIGRDNTILSQKKHVLVKTGFKETPRLIWSTLCLHILLDGGIIHESFEYTSKPSVSSDCQIRLGKNFQQFADSIDILSEYNNQKDLLDKYLRLYHVIENFMYKKPLVSLEKEANGAAFSIRDFKRMYDKINKTELAVLKSLSDDIMLLDFNPTTKFSNKILEQWRRLTSDCGADETKINSLLKILNVSTNKGKDFLFADVDADNLAVFFSKLVYSVRNSLVHNRETEFHLTHSTLLNHHIVSDTPRIMIERFLIPNLEEIAFYLIIKENDIVWYQNPTLKLWEM